MRSIGRLCGVPHFLCIQIPHTRPGARLCLPRVEEMAPPVQYPASENCSVFGFWIPTDVCSVNPHTRYFQRYIRSPFTPPVNIDLGLYIRLPHQNPKIRHTAVSGPDRRLRLSLQPAVHTDRTRYTPHGDHGRANDALPPFYRGSRGLYPVAHAIIHPTGYLSIRPFIENRSRRSETQIVGQGNRNMRNPRQSTPIRLYVLVRPE